MHLGMYAFVMNNNEVGHATRRHRSCSKNQAGVSEGTHTGLGLGHLTERA